MIKNMEYFGTEEENNYFCAREIIIADHLITYEIMRYYFLSLLCVIAFFVAERENRRCANGSNNLPRKHL